MTHDAAALQLHADTERRRLDDAIAVSEAESVVATARRSDLDAQVRAARRRLAAARGLLTRARRNGSADSIVRAARRAARAHAEFDRVSDAAIDEMFTLTRAGLDRVAALLDQMGRTWDAHAAASRALDHPEP